MANETYNEASNKANEAFDNAKKAASAGYEGAKEATKETASKLSDTVADYAKQGAEKLEEAADKIQTGTSDAFKTMCETVQKHPMASIAAAMVAGAVLVGMLRD